MIRYSAIVLFLILSGCVSVHTVEDPVIDDMCDETYECIGYAKWIGPKCDIYMMAKDKYPSIDEYNRILGHELDFHCIQKKEHPK